MGFTSILKKVGSVLLGIEHVAEPIVESLFPASTPLFGVFDRLSQAITTVEASITTPGSGPQKSAAVVADFNAGLQLTQSILALEGKALYYDPAALQTAIDAQVAAFNAFAAVKTSFKVVAQPTPAPAPPAVQS
jgi:crotonobetainyl-CoA:carnitine CoA-transferase CaiB-like acyl-CoA transferase